jgi:hypothetical protein
MKYVVCIAMHSHLVRISSHTVAQLRLIIWTQLPNFLLAKLFVQLTLNLSLPARILLYYDFKIVMLSGRALYDSCIGLTFIVTTNNNIFHTDVIFLVSYLFIWKISMLFGIKRSKKNICRPARGIIPKFLNRTLYMEHEIYTYPMN